MTPSPDAPAPYRVVYSQRVRESLRELLARARARGIGPRVLEAVRQVDERLRLYPQFGNPLIELTHILGQVRIGTIPPLVVRYAVYEERRMVAVTVPLLPLPGSGL